MLPNTHLALVWKFDAIFCVSLKKDRFICICQKIFVILQRKMRNHNN